MQCYSIPQHVPGHCALVQGYTQLCAASEWLGAKQVCAEIRLVWESLMGQADCSMHGLLTSFVLFFRVAECQCMPECV